jgi:hypothetical protein
MIPQSRRLSIAGFVAAVAMAVAALAGATTAGPHIGSSSVHVAGQVLPPPTRGLPPDPCRSAC